MKDRILIIIGMGTQREFGIKSLIKRENIRIVLIEGYSNKNYSALFDDTIFIDDINNIELVWNQIKSHLNIVDIKGVLTYVEHLVPVAVKVAQYLKLPTMTEETAYLARNKLLMRQQLERTKVKQPTYYFLDNTYDESIPSNISYPGVIKPVDMTASIGVKKIDSYDQLVEELKVIPKFNDNGYLFEEFIEGREFSAEGFVQNSQAKIICFTEKEVDTTQNYFVEKGHYLPYQFNKLTLQLEIQIKEIIQSLRLNNCVFHLEFKINDKNEFYFIEIAARPAGDYICDLIFQSLGINLYDILIDISLGSKVELNHFNCKNYSGIRYFNKTIEINETLRDINLININLNIKNKREKNIVKSNIERTGYIQIFHEEYKQLKNLLYKITNEES